MLHFWFGYLGKSIQGEHNVFIESNSGTVAEDSRFVTFFIDLLSFLYKHRVFHVKHLFPLVSG